MKHSQLQQLIREEIGRQLDLEDELYQQFLDSERAKGRFNAKDEIARNINDISMFFYGRNSRDLKEYLDDNSLNQLLSQLDQIKKLVTQYKSL